MPNALPASAVAGVSRTGPRLPAAVLLSLSAGFLALAVCLPDAADALRPSVRDSAELGPGYVVGVVRDELETERVQVLEVGPVE